MTGSPGRVAAVLLAVLTVAGACSGDGGGGGEAGPDPMSSSTSTTAPPETTTSSAAPTKTTPAAPPASTSPPARAQDPTSNGVPAAGVLVAGAHGAAVAQEPGVPAYGRLQPGVTVSYDAVDGDWARVLSPCENQVWALLRDGRVERAADVVLDPGHGGAEPGAVGPGGLTEKELNLDVARRAVDALRAAGVEAVLTRSADYRVTIASRVAVAAALRPEVFVSVHHNAEPDGPRDGPGSETYYQFRSAESKRLAGLLYEEIVQALSPFPAEWVADRDAGAKYRLSDTGDDYYGIIRRAGAAGLVASLAELGFISNPSEEALLRRDDVRQAEADALARAIIRFLRSDDPGSGFTVPYPRTTPAGPGGGASDCQDPLM